MDHIRISGTEPSSVILSSIMYGFCSLFWLYTLFWYTRGNKYLGRYCLISVYGHDKAVLTSVYMVTSRPHHQIYNSIILYTIILYIYASLFLVSRHLVLSHLGLAFVLMLRPFFPELVMSTDLLSFEHPSVLLFSFVYHRHDRTSYFRIVQNTQPSITPMSSFS